MALSGMLVQVTLAQLRMRKAKRELIVVFYFS